MPPRKAITRPSWTRGPLDVRWAALFAAWGFAALGCAAAGSGSAGLHSIVSAAGSLAEPATRTRIVEPGDTVWAIAGGTNRCVQEILAASGIRDPRRIQPGMRLTIPDASCPATRPPRVAAAPPQAPQAASRPPRVPHTAARASGREVAARETAPEPRAESTARSEGSGHPVSPESPEIGRRVAAALDRAEAQLRAAHFEEALANAREARVIARSGSTERAEEALRAHVVEANVHVALADRPAAARSLARALEIAPDLALDRSVTSPKVLEVLAAERTRREIRIAQSRVLR